MMRPRCLLGWLLLAALPLASGCGNSEVAARGIILRNNESVVFEPTDSVFLTFSTVDTPTERAFSGQVKKDGSFTVSGAQGGGIPPGKYRITLSTRHYGPPPKNTGGDQPPPKLTDKFDGAFSDPANSPLVVELQAGKQAITIDVGTNTVSAK
jgi:hypothetical protein